MESAIIYPKDAPHKLGQNCYIYMNNVQFWSKLNSHLNLDLRVRKRVKNINVDQNIFKIILCLDLYFYKIN